jgi:hypothetical protein
VPIYNITKTPILNKLSIEQVEKKIILALSRKGWRIISKKKGLIDAKINVRTHTAKIRVLFTKKHYSIHYLDSTNLKYNSNKKIIHKSYNNWIVYIEQQIQVELYQ